MISLIRLAGAMIAAGGALILIGNHDPVTALGMAALLVGIWLAGRED